MEFCSYKQISSLPFQSISWMPFTYRIKCLLLMYIISFNREGGEARMNNSLVKSFVLSIGFKFIDFFLKGLRTHPDSLQVLQDG